MSLNPYNLEKVADTINSCSGKNKKKQHRFQRTQCLFILNNYQKSSNHQLFGENI